MMQTGERCDFSRNIGQSLKAKRAKNILFDSQRPYFPRKILWFSQCVAEAKESFEKLVKYVPLGHQKALWGRFSPPKHCKIRVFRERKRRKTLEQKGEEQKRQQHRKKEASRETQPLAVGRW